MAASIPPTYEDATLVLRLYELRREEKLRAAREWFRAKFFPATFEELKAVASGAGIENTHYRMVTTYWEMAASFVARGILHPDLFFDSGGEALFVWAKIGEFVPTLRQDSHTPHLLVNLERAIAMATGAAERVRGIRSRMAAYKERVARESRA